jgi:addiction module HigA family antidote
MRMHNPPHPGTLLRALWLEPLNLSVTQVAAQLQVSRKTLSEIVNAKAAVTAEMALRLELAFGKSAESWLGHQSQFDLWQLHGREASLGVQRISTDVSLADTN